MRKKKSAILEAVHETAKDLHQAGLMNQTTLREFEHLCLPPIEPLEPLQIKQIRESSQVSQAVFARILNIIGLTHSTVMLNDSEASSALSKILRYRCWTGSKLQYDILDFW